MRAVLGFFLGLLVGIAVLVGVYRYRPSASAELSPTPSPVPSPVVRASPTPAPAARVREVVLLARVRADGAWEEIFLADGGQARPVPMPDTADPTTMPVTDGERMYAFVLGSGQGAVGSRGRRLVALTREGDEDEVIAEETPLISLRGLFPSPDGKTIAFFHDDRRGTNTELWTYDALQRKKRVAVENLSPEVRGPFFGSDGSFLLEDRGRVWAGGPRRTGADLLPVTLPDGLRWDRGVARMPTGGSLVAVTESGAPPATVSRVVELPLAAARLKERLAATGVVIRLLGATPAGDVAAVSEEAQPTLWFLRAGSRASFPLGAGAREPVLAAEGNGVAFLRAARLGEGTRSSPDVAAQVLVLKLPEGTIRELLRLPAEPAPTAGAPLTARLVQYLRTSVAPSPVSGGAQFPPATVLLFVADRLAEIAEAPPGESLALERVWFTRAPDAVYVEYRVGTTLWRRLVRLSGEGAAPSGVAVVGVFTPTEGEWSLARGEDLTEGDPVALYEYDPDFQQWVEKPLAPLEAGRL